MLDISKPLTSGKVQSYYRSEYSAASNSYFTEGGSLRGQWHGQLAAELGLSGVVTAEAFDRLSEGQHPQTGEQLIAHRHTIKQANGEELGHRAGWDLTFNAPKTVSLTALVGGDERVREAHRHAVQVALTELEKYAQARMGGNHAAETTGKWIVATFDHDTARPVDGYPAPHLHTHAVLFNLTEDATGQARSLQPYELFKIQSMATAVYQNQLEYDLRAFGYGIERGTNHAPDIRGYSAEYLSAESLRNAEIKQGMEDRGVTGREAESLAAHQTREEKLKLTPDELRALHQAKAEAFGNQPGQVVAAAQLAERQDIPNRQKEAIRAGKSVAHARERLTERSAAIEHFEVVRDALRRAQGKAQLGDIQAAIRAEREQGHLLTVEHVRPYAPAWRYTTPELIGIERSAIRTMQEGQGKLESIAPLTDEAIGERFSHLNRDQRQLVYEALHTPDQVFGVQGGAGTGKTTALDPIREVAVEHGYATLGLAATSGAVKALRNSGLEAETLQSFLLQPLSSGEGAKPRLYFVDESSLASGKQMEGFLSRLQPSDRVLLIGDTRQHQSVEAGRIFAELQDAGMHTASLNEIVRQKDEELRQAVQAMAAGRIAEGVDQLIEQGRVHTVEHRAERFQAIAAAYAAAPEGTLIVSPDNQSRAEINSAVRNQLRQSQQLGETEYTAAVLANRQDVTTADRAVAHSYHVGDSVQYMRGSKQLGLPAKSYAQVTAVDSEHNRITVEAADGKSITYDPARLTGVALYQPKERTFAVGERVQFTTPWKDQGISNREMGTVTHLDTNGNIRVQLDDSHRTVGWNLRTYQHLDYAYAMTSHSAQGQTVDRVLIHIDTGDSRIRSLVDQSLAYVATSRPRHDAQIFTDNAEGLSQALSRRNENVTALSPSQIDRYAQTGNEENSVMPGVVADYVRQVHEEENQEALMNLEHALERPYWPSERELNQASDWEFEQLEKEIHQLAAQDLRDLQERYPGQEPAELLESYNREQTLGNQEQTAIPEMQLEERIALVSEGEWQSDFDGESEHRVSIGRSPEGFHYDIESSYQGGEPNSQGWSTQAYPSAEAAETAAQPKLDALIDNDEAEDHKYSYSEGLSI